MIDLTPLDVRKKRGDFRRILRGYDPGEVDTFLELVEARLEALVMENLALAEKVQRLGSQLEALEGRERAVQDALVTAQKLREEVQNQSKREADSVRGQAEREAESLREQVQRETESLRGEAHREASILRDEAIREAAAVRDHARREAELLRKEVIGEIEARILEAEGLIKERQRALEDLERSRRKFLKGFRTLLEREMDAVEVEEARRPLEDTPLELNLRGWAEAREKEAEEESEADVSVGDEPEPDPAPPGYEPVIDLDVASHDGVGEDSGPEGWGALPGDEPPSGEFSDIVPVGVFDLPPGGGGPAESPEGTEESVAADPPEEESGGEGEPGGGEASLTVEGESGALGSKDPGKVDATFGSTVEELLGSRSAPEGAPPPEPPWLSSLLEHEGGGEHPERGDDLSSPSGRSPAETAEAGEEWADDENEPRID